MSSSDSGTTLVFPPEHTGTDGGGRKGKGRQEKRGDKDRKQVELGVEGRNKERKKEKKKGEEREFRGGRTKKGKKGGNKAG